MARFHREAKLAAGLSHPNVVAVLDQDTQVGRPYLVMEYVPGGTLADRIALGGLDRWDLKSLAIDLLRTLAYLHGAGVLHRDLKPANVLLGTDGRLRLTDFGVAALTDATRVTSTGELIGTQRYLAPEVLAGRPADERSDLYSCGVLLAECAGPDLPPPLAALIARLTQPDPARRPASATAALALLTPGLDPTAPIRSPLPLPGGPAATMAVPTGFGPGEGAGSSRRSVAAVVAAVVLGTAGVVLTEADGAAPAAPTAPTAPASPTGSAPAAAPIDDRGLAGELDALHRAIDALGR